MEYAFKTGEATTHQTSEKTSASKQLSHIKVKKNSSRALL
jgi:hypothetical protein